MTDSFAERLVLACKKHQAPNPFTEEGTAIFYYPDEGVIQLEGEFTARQLRALLEAMGEKTP